VLEIKIKTKQNITKQKQEETDRSIQIFAAKRHRDLQTLLGQYQKDFPVLLKEQITEIGYLKNDEADVRNLLFLADKVDLTDVDIDKIKRNLETPKNKGNISKAKEITEKMKDRNKDCIAKLKKVVDLATQITNRFQDILGTQSSKSSHERNQLIAKIFHYGLVVVGSMVLFAGVTGALCVSFGTASPFVVSILSFLGISMHCCVGTVAIGAGVALGGWFVPIPPDFLEKNNLSIDKYTKPFEYILQNILEECARHVAHLEREIPTCSLRNTLTALNNIKVALGLFDELKF